MKKGMDVSSIHMRQKVAIFKPKVAIFLAQLKTAGFTFSDIFTLSPSNSDNY